MLNFSLPGMCPLPAAAEILGDGVTSVATGLSAPASDPDFDLPHELDQGVAYN